MERTFDEWKAEGYWIIKGSKSIGRSPEGKALFDESQVRLQQPLPSEGYTKTFIEEASDRARAKGTPHGVIADFDSFVREASMLPDLRPRTVAIHDPMEQYFMGVAAKHGILDSVIDGDEDIYFGMDSLDEDSYH